MSENNAPVNTETPDFDAGDLCDFQAPDELLAGLVSAAHQGLKLSVTLWVGGAVVTGSLVGRAQWIDSLVEAYGDELALLNDVQRMWAADDAAVEDPLMVYIHLVDAKTLIYENSLNDQGAFWRGRLASVDGWAFGSMERSSD